MSRSDRRAQAKNRERAGTSVLGKARPALLAVDVGEHRGSIRAVLHRTSLHGGQPFHGVTPALRVRRAITGLVMLVPSSAMAESPGPSFGVRDAVVLAVNRNPTLAVSAAEVTIAHAGVTKTAGLDDLLWDGSVSWARSRREIVAGIPVQEPRSDDFLLSTSLTRLLPTGGTLGLRLTAEVARGDYATDVGNAFETSTSQLRLPSAKLFFTQPLLRGAGVDVARAPVRRARVARDAAQLAREAVEAIVIRDVVVAYWATLMARQELAIGRTLTESAQRQLLAVQANIAVRKEPASAEAEVAVAIAQRLDDQMIAEAALREQSVELTRVLGLPLDPERTYLVPSDDPEIPTDMPDRDVVLADAVANSPELAAAHAQGPAAAIDVEVGENGLLPQLDVSLSATSTGDSPNTDQSFRQLGGLRSYDLQLGVVFQEEIGKHAARGTLEAARGGLRRIRLREAEIAAQVEAAVVQDVERMTTARRRIDALSQAATSADFDLAAMRARYEVGRATNFDVLRRQDELANVQSRALRARIEYLRAQASLEALTGEIFAHYGIRP